MAGPEQEPPVVPDDNEEWEEEAPRSLLSTTWFRTVIVVLVVGAVAAVAVPMVTDSVRTPPVATTPPSTPPVAAPAPAPAAPVATSVAPTPSTPNSPAATKAETPAPAAPAKPDGPKMPAPAAKLAAPKGAATEPDRAAAVKSDAPWSAKTGKTKSTSPEAGGELWVQVGAFRDATTAKKVATDLKEKGYRVSESTLTLGGDAPAATPSASAGSSADKYDVLVTGAAPADLAKKLSAKGLSADTVRDGAVVRPSLPLRDGVMLSNDLRAEGFTVTVRRVVTGAATAPPASSSAGTGSGNTLHRVRIGVFPDRAAATAAVDKLREFGYTPFIAGVASDPGPSTMSRGR